MAIEGPLRELALPDVVQLLHLSRKTGTLSVRSDGFARPGVLLFRDGAVVGGRSPGESSHLGRLLLMAGKATATQVERALEEQRRTPTRRLGAILVESQGVPAAEVERQLRFQVEEAVFELVRWTDGYFRFEEIPPPDPGPITLRLSTESLLMEALRRVDEWSVLASGQPDTTLVPRLVEPDAATLLRLQPQEWEVLAGVDGDRSLRAIARELGQAEFEVAKAVYGLVSAGIVELGKRTAPLPGGPRESAGAAPELRRVEEALRQGRLGEAEQWLVELQARKLEPGAVDLLRGRLEAGRGRWEAAIDALEAAIQQDPLLGSAYYHLGVAALRTGDLSRAEESLRTCVRLPDTAPAERATAERAAALVADLRELLEENE